MKSSRLFVYGTLRRGSSNEFARLLQAKSQFLGNGRMPARLYQLSRYQGAMLSDRSDEWVPGELYRLKDPGILSTLDEYEGSEFERTLVTVALDSGRELEAWVYLLRRKP